MLDIADARTTSDRRKHASIGFHSIGLVWGAVWFSATMLGVIVLAMYGNTPGTSAPDMLQSSWPAASRLFRRAGHKTLVVFAHPHCPCTRATLEELQRIFARSRAIPTTHIVFIDAGPADREAVLWRTATTIPGVQVVKNGGNEARIFQAFTSGQTFLFDESGKLRFAGGITGARGHAGDNSGASAVLSILNTGQSPQERTFVFGCALSASSENTQ